MNCYKSLIIYINSKINQIQMDPKFNGHLTQQLNLKKKKKRKLLFGPPWLLSSPLKIPIYPSYWAQCTSNYTIQNVYIGDFGSYIPKLSNFGT
jgi:hypothetical protein